MSQNVAAFFLGSLWFLYRKMFWPGVLIIAAVMIENIAETLLFPDLTFLEWFCFICGQPQRL